MLEFKKIGIYFLSFLLFSGCSFIDEPVREFLKEYTETAAIERHEYAETVAIDRYGIDCLSSEKDKEIYLYLRNPQLYDLDLGIVSDSGVASAATFSIAQNPDKISSTITLKESFLTSIECGEYGRDFSPTISVVEKKSRRKFADYTFALKINSVPPVPYGAVVLVTSGVQKKYVLCFNLPGKADVKGIHQDITSVTIESNGSVPKRKIFLTPDSSGAVSLAADENGSPLYDVKNSVSEGEITENTEQEGAAGLGFTSGENPVYVFTDDELVPIIKNITYKITLEDNDGLSSTASTSVYSQKLEKPKATAVRHASNTIVELDDAEYSEIMQNEDGAGYVKLILPTSSTTGLSVSSCSVVYEIYDDSADSTLLGRGTVSSSMEIPVPPFECKIKAYAENPAYVPSDFAWFHVKPVCTKLYVSEGGSAGSEGGWGTKKKPFNRISTALAAGLFADKTDSENRIVLLSDVQDENININDTYCFTLTSQNSDGNAVVHTITPVSESSCFMKLGTGATIFVDNVCIKDFTSSSSGAAFSVADASLRLTDVEVTGNTSSDNGGAFYLSNKDSVVSLYGKTVVSSNTATSGNGVYIANKEALLSVNDDSYFDLNDDVYLCKNAVLYASALCTSDKIACISLEEYPDDPAEAQLKVLSPSDQNALNADFCNSKIEVSSNPDNPDLEYYVVYFEQKRCGILAQGTSANVSTQLPDKVIFHQLYMEGLYLTFYATDGSGNILNPQQTSIKVKLRSDVIASETKSNEYVKLNIPDDKEEMIEDGMIDGDKVTVELSIKVSGIVYSVTEDIVSSFEIYDAVTFANAVDFINTLDGKDAEDINISIATDIEVADSTPLLGTLSHKFNGTFDGKGHTITVKKTGSTRMAAIADYVGPKGVIKNVVIGGNYQYIPGDDPDPGLISGGIAVENEGLIINCFNYLDIEIKSTDDTGGITGINRGRIVNCANFGNLTNVRPGLWAMVCGKLGGITGRSDGSGVIENCFNYGQIKSKATSDLDHAPNGLPGAITGSQSGNAKGINCYWKDDCVKRGSSYKSESYNSYACKNSIVSFFWTYGADNSDNGRIVVSDKYNETFITSCGTFADAASGIVAGTEQNSEHAQTLKYTGTLLDAMNAYVNANSKKYNFNGTEVDLLEWEADSSHDDYPKLKF